MRPDRQGHVVGEPMPRTVTLSEGELAALQAIRQFVADVPHPARPEAISALDRIAAAPEDSPHLPVVVRSGAIPLDPTQPDGHRCSSLEWRSDWPMTDIGIPEGQDLVLELRRPASACALLRWHVEAGADHSRALPSELLGCYAAKVADESSGSGASVAGNEGQAVDGN